MKSVHIPLAYTPVIHNLLGENIRSTPAYLCVPRTGQTLLLQTSKHPMFRTNECAKL